MRLSSLAWRGLAARPLRTALTIVGVALGVAVLTAAIVAGSSSEAALRAATADLLGSADVRLRAFDEAGFGPRTVQALRSVEGVVEAAPVSQRQLLVTTAPGEDEQVFTLLVLGVDPAVDPTIREPRLRSGDPLGTTGAPEALVPASWAAEHGLGLGDELRLAGDRPGTPRLVIVGLLDDSGLAALGGGNVLVMARDVLDESLLTPAPITAIDLDLADGNPDAALERATAVLTEPYVVETPAEAAARLAPEGSSFSAVALLFALVALVVGAFLVGNAMAMTVGERTRELALLRAAGTTSRQVLGIVARQAAVIGLLGSAVGVIAGVLLAVLLIGALDSTRAVLDAGLSLPIVGLAVAFGLGLVVTLAGAALPAARAAAISPLDGLRPSRRPERRLGERLRPILLVEAVLLALAVLAAVAIGEGTPIVAVLVALVALIGGTVAAAFLLAPLGRVVGRPFEWFFGAQGMLGRVNLSRDRARTGLTVGAMMIALAAVVALGTVAESARSGVEARVASILPGGHAIRSGIPLDVETYRPTFEATTGLRAASPVLEVPVVRVTDEERVEAVVAGIDPNLYADEGALLVSGASREAAFDALRAGGAVLVPESLATRDGIEVGDVVTLGRPGGEGHDLTVAGLLEVTLPARTADGALLVSAADARDRFGATAASLWVMLPSGEVPATAFSAAVRETAAGLAAQPMTARDLTGELSRTLDGLIGLFDVLALASVVIAALGIVNTLGMGVSERVREIAILRSHGMTVGQVQAMVVAEAAMMGTIAGILALAVGLVVAFVLVSSGASADLAAGVHLPWPLLVAVVLVGTGVAALAGLYPARVAATMPIVGNLKHFE
jgi:putative ABC transport system permease protein